MTMHALHQAAADGTIFSTLEPIPTPSQPGQRHDDGNGDQPTHKDNGSREQLRGKDCWTTALPHHQDASERRW